MCRSPEWETVSVDQEAGTHLTDTPAEAGTCALDWCPVPLRVTLRPPLVHPEAAGLQVEVVLRLLGQAVRPTEVRHLDAAGGLVLHLAGEARPADSLQ